MIQRLLKPIWAERNSVERWLIVVLAVVALCFVLVSWAWMVQLRPWAPVWGTVADWIAAGGTVLGFAAAVTALNKSTRDQKNQRQEDIHAEASRVAMTLEKPHVNFTDYEDLVVNFSYNGSVHNAASSPIRGVRVALDMTKLSAESRFDSVNVSWDLGTVPAGGSRGFLIQGNVPDPMSPPASDELVKAVTLLFTDVHGNNWDQTADMLTRTKP